MPQQTVPITQIPQELRDLVLKIPLFDERVWNPLQKKDYKSASEKLFGILSVYTKKAVDEVLWKKIIEGQADIRGDVSLGDWRTKMIPYLAAILLEIADEELFEKIYHSLETETLISFHFSIIEEIPGISPEEKIEHLKKNNPWLYEYFMGSPLNAVFNGIFMETSENIPKQNLEKTFKYLSQFNDGLKIAFFSVDIGRNLYRTCKNFSLDEQTTIDVSSLIGDVLMGLINKEELREKIISLKFKNDFPFEEFLEEVVLSFIDLFSEDTLILKETVEVVVKEPEIYVPVKAEEEKTDAQPIKITKVEFPARTADIEPDRFGGPDTANGTAGAPFMLHKEQDIAVGGGDSASPFKKGSTFSFGFFKPGNRKKDEKKEVSVKIESPEQQESIKTKETTKPLEIKILPIEEKKMSLEKPPESKSIPVKTEPEKPKASLPITNIPKPVPVKVQNYAAAPAFVDIGASQQIKLSSTTPAPHVEQESETPKPASGEKKIHYSAFKTDLPAPQELSTPKTDPHVDGNVLFFK